MRRSVNVLVCAFVMAGCVAKEDDAERFRQAVPLAEDVALRVPSGSNAGGTTTKGLRLSGGPTTTTSSAEYYRFTRDLTGAIDFGTGVILGSIWIVVHTQPTAIDAKHAVWGPGNGSALDPVVWRFTVTEVGDQEYDYVLEGQRKGTTDWIPALTGHGDNKTGWFAADNDAWHQLDPEHDHDTGSTKVTFDLRKLPATIAVERKDVDAQWVNIDVTHEAGGAGSVEITGHADFDAAKGTKPEDIRLVSRWLTNGSGRADAQLENGDMPLKVNASECWSDSLARVYYKDTVDYEPPSGDATKCSLDAAKL